MSRRELYNVAARWAFEISFTQKLLSDLRYILALADLNLGMAICP
jgi:hypothetical protein